MSGPPDDLRSWSRAVTLAVTILALASVTLRMLSRVEKKQRLWWDDYIIIWAMAWNIAVVGFIFAMIQLGMGLHADTLPPENVVLIAKLLVVAETMYVYNLVWTKLSFLFMLYRIFHFPYFKKWTYIIGTFVIAWVICITFLFVFICVPVQKLWHPSSPGHCINQVATWVANGSSTILTDLAILILPIPQIWKLQLRRSDKIALTFIFGLGFFVIFASAYRLTVLFTYTTDDPSYTLAPTVGWTAIEMSAGIVSACLPTLGPALSRLARLTGLDHAWSGLVSKKTSSPANLSRFSTGKGKNTAHHPTRRASQTQPGVEVGDGNFYRLSVEVESNDEEPVTVLRLRPEQSIGYQITTSRGSNGELESLSGDEVPLNKIKVRTVVNQTRD